MKVLAVVFCCIVVAFCEEYQDISFEDEDVGYHHPSPIRKCFKQLQECRKNKKFGCFKHFLGCAGSCHKKCAEVYRECRGDGKEDQKKECGKNYFKCRVNCYRSQQDDEMEDDVEELNDVVSRPQVPHGRKCSEQLRACQKDKTGKEKKKCKGEFAKCVTGRCKYACVNVYRECRGDGKEDRKKECGKNYHKCKSNCSRSQQDDEMEISFEDEDVGYHHPSPIRKCFKQLQECRKNKKFGCFKHFLGCAGSCHKKCAGVYRECKGDGKEDQKKECGKKYFKCRVNCYRSQQDDEMEAHLEDEDVMFHHSSHKCFEQLSKCQKNNTISECTKRFFACTARSCQNKCVNVYRECARDAKEDQKKQFECAKNYRKCRVNCSRSQQDDEMEDDVEEVNDVVSRSRVPHGRKCSEQLRACQKDKTGKEKYKCIGEFAKCMTGPCKYACYKEKRECYGKHEKGDVKEHLKCQKEAIMCLGKCSDRKKMGYSFRSVSCDACKYSLEHLEEMLGSVASKTAIERGVSQLCDKLPNSFESECNALVGEYGDDIIDLIINEFAPNDICQSIRLC